jgi:hypothetical protein
VQLLRGQYQQKNAGGGGNRNLKFNGQGHRGVARREVVVGNTGLLCSFAPQLSKRDRGNAKAVKHA